MLTKVIVYNDKDFIYSFAYCGKELKFVLTDKPGIASEAIFLARITKFNQANRTAFIEYLPGKTGFINLGTHAKVHDGSTLAVQLTWLGDGQKAAKFRDSWQLVGKYLVYTPSKSSKIVNKYHACAATLTEIPNIYPGQWVIRSCVSSKADISHVLAEAKLIHEEGQQIQMAAEPGLYYAGVSNYRKLLRSIKLSPECEIITNDSSINQDLLSLQDLWQIDAITFDPGLNGQALIEHYKQQLLATIVTLANGASLEINTFAGITIIDVNSAKVALNGGSLNFLVLDEIYQQICIRNLQGIILLDLIKNMNKEQEEKIINYLEKLFKSDVTHTKILGFSNAGLCEIIRNKF